MNALFMPPNAVSISDYLAGEEIAEFRSEYIDGRIYARDMASTHHCLITGALISMIRPASRNLSCRLFASAFKLRLETLRQTVFYYPDLMLVCDPLDRHDLFATRPCLIIEILSESTERIDRREKFLAYQTLPSLLEYVLIAQVMPRVEIYRRTQAWEAEIFTEGAFHLDCLDLNVSVNEVYADVDFPPPVYKPRW